MLPYLPSFCNTGASTLFLIPLLVFLSGSSSIGSASSNSLFFVTLADAADYVQCGSGIGQICTAAYPICCDGFCVSSGDFCCSEENGHATSCDPGQTCCGTGCCDAGTVCSSDGVQPVCVRDLCSGILDPGVCLMTGPGSFSDGNVSSSIVTPLSLLSSAAAGTPGLVVGDKESDTAGSSITSRGFNDTCHWCCETARCMSPMAARASSQCSNVITSVDQTCQDKCSYSTTCASCLGSGQNESCAWESSSATCVNRSTTYIDPFTMAHEATQCASILYYGAGLVPDSSNYSFWSLGTTGKAVLALIAVLFLALLILGAVKAAMIARHREEMTLQMQNDASEQFAHTVRAIVPRFGFVAEGESSSTGSSRRCTDDGDDGRHKSHRSGREEDEEPKEGEEDEAKQRCDRCHSIYEDSSNMTESRADLTHWTYIVLLPCSHRICRECLLSLYREVKRIEATPGAVEAALALSRGQRPPGKVSSWFSRITRTLAFGGSRWNNHSAGKDTDERTALGAGDVSDSPDAAALDRSYEEALREGHSTTEVTQDAVLDVLRRAKLYADPQVAAESFGGQSGRRANDDDSLSVSMQSTSSSDSDGGRGDRLANQQRSAMAATLAQASPIFQASTTAAALPQTGAACPVCREDTNFVFIPCRMIR